MQITTTQQPQIQNYNLILEEVCARDRQWDENAFEPHGRWIAAQTEWQKEGEEGRLAKTTRQSHTKRSNTTKGHDLSSKYSKPSSKPFLSPKKIQALKKRFGTLLRMKSNGELTYKVRLSSCMSTFFVKNCKRTIMPKSGIFILVFLS